MDRLFYQKNPQKSLHNITHPQFNRFICRKILTICRKVEKIFLAKFQYHKIFDFLRIDEYLLQNDSFNKLFENFTHNRQ